MIEYDIKQLWYEFETWRRLLEFIQIENIYCKNRLAHITKEQTDNFHLSDIEIFQHEFLMEDNIIASLRKDVASLEAWMRREVLEESADLKDVIKGHKKLRREIEMYEQKYNKLKFEFNIFFGEKLFEKTKNKKPS